MAENLVQHRGGPSVWDNSGPGLERIDAGRLIAAAAAGALLLVGLRRRSAGGLLAAVAGGGLAWCAASSHDSRRNWLAGVQRTCGLQRGRREDLVNEAAEESFPASDAPALTPPALNRGAAPESRGARLFRH